MGQQAGNDNTTGNYNTLVGYGAGEEIITGSKNTVLGYDAFQKAGGPEENIAIGYGAMRGSQNGTPKYNIGMGYAALENVTSGGEHNIALAHSALEEVTTGDYNIGLGRDAGDTITTGSHNIALGYKSDVSASSAAGQYAIGRETVTDQNYQVAIGYGSTGNIRVEYDTDATWTQSSDLRKKKNINDMTLGLDFIDKLKPITYQWKPNNELPKEFKEYQEENVKDTETVMSGLGAQDVKQALEEVGYTERFPGWKEEEDGSQRISKEEFVIPLINAIQELRAEVKELKEKLNNGNS